MICRVATSRTNKRLIRPFDFRQVLQAVLVAFESVIELNGIHTFEYFSLYHATKVAINIGLGALSAYTYPIILNSWMSLLRVSSLNAQES